MNSGRELDELIANKVMGLVYDESEPNGFYKWKPVSKCLATYVDGLPPYSTDISAAWEVLEHLNHMFEVSRHFTGYLVTINPAPGIQFHGAAENAPHAICMAAIKLMEGWEKE